MTPESAPVSPAPADPMAGPRGAARSAAPRAVRGALGRTAASRTARGAADRTAVGRVSRRAALAALAGIPALAACTRTDGAAGGTPTGAPPPAVGSMVPEVRDLKVDVKQPNQGDEGWSVALTPQEGLKNDRAVVLPSQAGPLVALVSKYYDESLGNSPDSPDAALMSFDPADGSLAWARLVSLPGGTAPRWEDGLGRLDYQVRETASRSAVAVSPDGRHVCVILRAYVSPVLSEHVSAAAVLDTASGRVVRAEEIRGLVLGQALTDDALIVQTSDFPYPGGDTVIAGPSGSNDAAGTGDAAGAGAGGSAGAAGADAGGGAGGSSGAGSTLTAFPLADPQAPPATGSTPLWLLGATHDSLILGGVRIDPECLEGNCLGYRAVLATASGRVTGQIDGVYAVHPNGFLERFTGGETDDDFLTRTAQSQNPNLTPGTPDPDEELSRRQTWAALGRELLDPASGAAADITGLTLSHVPTATTWITARWRPAWSQGDGNLSFAPEAAGWMAAPGDPVSTEPAMTMNCAGNPSADSPVITVSLVRTPFTGRPV